MNHNIAMKTQTFFHVWPNRFLSTILASCLVLTAAARAELKPDQVGIVAMARSAASRDVAKYYASARGIPRSRICMITATPGTVLARKEWEQAVRPQIRAWFANNGLQNKIRCLVTVWDVPLKIGKQLEQSSGVGARKEFLSAERRNRWNLAVKLANEMNQLARDTSDVDAVIIADDVESVELATRLQTIFRGCQDRLNRLGAQADPQALQQFQQALLTINGLRTVAQAGGNTEQAAALNDEKRSQIDLARGRLIGLNEGKNALESLPASVARDEKILAIVQLSSGLIGSLAWTDNQLTLLQSNDTYSSFDSELSLLFWPDYPVDRWLPNLLHHRYDGQSQRWQKPTLMVSRLEAPTMRLTKKLAETAIETERTGLQGKVYLDARQPLQKLEGAAPDPFAQYDLSLHGLADGLRKHSNLSVILDTKPDLFQPDSCPDAALYSGWYSMAKYVDAFQWTPGSVGFHIASGEAAALRNTSEPYWCKRMLEDGVCATLGPVYEPYLSAFPKPDEFFALLMSGQYTLVEAYYRTNPYNSWVMVLIGDPLYNPFRNNPPFTDSNIPEAWRRLINDGHRAEDT